MTDYVRVEFQFPNPQTSATALTSASGQSITNFNNQLSNAKFGTKLTSLFQLQNKWTSIQYSEGLDQAFYSFTVEFSGLENLNLVKQMINDSLNAVLYINDTAIAYGILSDFNIKNTKEQGCTTSLKFDTMCSLLAKISLNPHLVYFTGSETLQTLIGAIVSNYTSANVLFDPAAAKVTYNSDLQVSSTIVSATTYSTGLKPLHSKDIQPKPGESAFSFLQKIARRHGLFIRDSVKSVGNIVQPSIIVSPPQLVSPNPALTTTYALNRNKIVNTSNGLTAALSDIRVISQGQQIKALMPLVMFGYGNTYNPDLTTSSYKVAVWNDLLVKNRNYTGQLLNKDYGINQPYFPDMFLQKIGSTQNVFDVTNNLPISKQYKDTYSIQDLYNKCFMDMMAELNAAYTLTYEITAENRPPILSDDYVYIEDEFINVISPLMYVQATSITFSKDKGYVQTVTLKLPNTFRVGDK
jgi:hypothetical protein